MPSLWKRKKSHSSQTKEELLNSNNVNCINGIVAIHISSRQSAS